MASETMESAIMMEVQAIETELEALRQSDVPSVHMRVEAIEHHLCNIRDTLNEGDPSA